LIEEAGGIPIIPESTPPSDWRFIHGAAFALLLVCALAVPVLRQWPWIWLAPLAAYFVLVAFVPRLRQSLHWCRMGRLSPWTVAATLGVMTLTTLALVAFHCIAQPDMSGFRGALPFAAMGGVVTAGVIFTIVNATLEELVFRGVLFDALLSQRGVWITLLATSALFGLGHLQGYPSGPAGAGLAALFGFGMGVLRLWTGGLALPIAAHMVADATIYGILVHSGVA
jgi:hypothetical protein